MTVMNNGPAPRRCLELEIGVGEKIVRVSCFNSDLEQAPSYVGARLADIVVSDDFGSKRSGAAVLAGGSSCTYSVEPGDPYGKVAVDTSDPVRIGDFAGCYANLDRLAEMIDSSTGLPFTFGAAFPAPDTAAEEHVCSAQHCLLNTLHDLMAIVACDGPVIYFVLPKIENRELGQVFALFHAEWFEAHGTASLWKFGVVEGQRPYDTRGILSRALNQAHTGNTFERSHDLNRAS